MSRTGGIQLWVPSENSLIPSYTQYAEYRAKKNGYPEIDNTDTWSIPSAGRALHCHRRRALKTLPSDCPTVYSIALALFTSPIKETK